jgi:small-conductance mechanosensitive channel
MLGVEGVVEQINLRSTFLRAPNGEVYVVPNGDVRLLRNFSRSLFSNASLHVKLAAADLERALPVLTGLGGEAPEVLPDLIEPWQVIADTGTLGRTVTVLLVIKARFGTAAEVRPRLMALVQRRLAEAEIPLAD